MVVLPGFMNWYELSLVARDLLLHLMIQAQGRAAVSPHTWKVWKLTGNSPEDLYSYIVRIQQDLNAGSSTFVYAKFSGAIHAFLVYDIVINADVSNALLHLRDSNSDGAPDIMEFEIDNIQKTAQITSWHNVSTGKNVYEQLPLISLWHERLPEKLIKAWNKAAQVLH